MAAITLSQMRQRILKEVKDSQQTQYESFIDDAIRSAISFYSDAKLWFLETRGTIILSSATDSVSLPSNFQIAKSLRISVDSVWRGKDNGFRPVTWDELEDDYRDSAATGAPDKWAILGASLYVNRLADDDYTIQVTYYKKDTSLPDDDNDTSVFFDEAQNLIRLKATEYFYRDRLHNFERAADYEIRAEKELLALQRINLRRKATTGLLAK